MDHKHYIFGNLLDDITKQDIYYIFVLAKKKKYNLLDLKTEDILKIIDKVSNFWLDLNNPYYPIVFENLTNIGFSKKMIELAILELSKIFTYDNMLKRLEIELGKIQKNTMVFPLGILAHITAGNVFVSAIDSLICGIITKNLNIVKSSSKVGNLFGILWLESLRKAEREMNMEGAISDNIAIFSYKSEELIEYFNNYTDGLVVWGSYNTIKYFSSNYDPRKRLIIYGPKYSISVIDSYSLTENLNNDDFYNKLAWDICLWEQRACSSVQTIYIVGKSNPSDLKIFATNLSRNIENFQIEQAELSFDEYVEIFKYEEIMMANEILGYGKYFNKVYLDYDKYDLFIGPLNRFVAIKNTNSLDELIKLISPYSDILQSCSLLVKDKEKFVFQLAKCGITRFVEIGKIGFSEIFAPHEGEYILRKFSKFISIT